MSSVIINGDRDNFLSKRAVERLKTDIRNNKEIIPTNYFKNGYTCLKSVKDNNITVTIVSDSEYELHMKKKLLKSKLRQTQQMRGGEQKRKLDSIKRCVPEKVFKAYQEVLKVGNFNVASPDEMINNVDKYRGQISMINGNPGMISNDSMANIVIKKYFKLMGELLGIEPMNLTQPSQTAQTAQTATPIALPNNDKNDDTEDEEVPTLV